MTRNKETLALNLKGCRIWWNENPKLFITSALCSITEALTPYVGIYLSARLLNELAGNRNPHVLTQLIIAALVSAALLTLGLAGLQRWKNCQHSTLWHMENKIYNAALLRMDFQSVDDGRIRETLAQVKQNRQWDFGGVHKILPHFEQLLKAVMTILGAFALTVPLFLQPVPAHAGALTVLNNPAVIMIIIAILCGVSFMTAHFSTIAAFNLSKAADKMKTWNNYFSFFAGIGFGWHRSLDIRIYQQDVYCKHKITTGLMDENNVFNNQPYYIKYVGSYYALAAAASQLFTGFVFVFVCIKAWSGAFGVGSVIQYIGAITALAGGMSALVSGLGNLRNNAPFLRTAFSFLETPNDMYQGSLSVEKRSDKKYEIEFRSVSFKYAGTDAYVLKNISLTFHVGERLALVGMNGSGKTTFIKLLCRLYDPTEGEILLNGINIRKYDYREYMSIFSVVFQDFQLLAFTLGQNLAAKWDYDRQLAIKSLLSAGFGERFYQMAEGLNTYLYKAFDEKGVEISGGEAQKIAMARALYKDAAFIVLDEPTAALDPIAEFEVYSKMNEIVGGKTAVFISHRLSSCRFCNDIAVFHEGEIVQRGSHERLVKEGEGQYARLWDAQARYYADTLIPE